MEALSGGSLTSSPVVSEALTQFTSSVIVLVEGEVLMFVGTSGGRLLKVGQRKVIQLIIIRNYTVVFL